MGTIQHGQETQEQWPPAPSLGQSRTAWIQPRQGALADAVVADATGGAAGAGMHQPGPDGRACLSPVVCASLGYGFASQQRSVRAPQ